MALIKIRGKSKADNTQMLNFTVETQLIQFIEKCAPFDTQINPFGIRKGPLLSI